MKETKRRRSLSGAVLVMILTVMFILIILLTATLTTVTTANQRIYTKFEENQAYYTARSALDVFTQNMLADSNYLSGKTYDYTDIDVTPVKKETKQMKQGLALQLDLYKINSQCETYGKDGSGDSKLKWAENMKDADGIFCEANMGYGLGTYAETDNFSIASGTGNELNKDGTFDYIEYQVTLPTLSDGSNEYGKFVDVDNSATATSQLAKIKVEVLDRVYATDPSYTADQIQKYFDTTVSAADKLAAGCPANDAALKAAIANGSRSKDYMKLKITSTVTVWGIEGVAVVIIETNEKNAPAGNRAITTTGSLSGGSGAMVRTAGGAATMDTGITKVGDGNNMMGTLYTLGKFEWTSASAIQINKGDSVVAMGGLAPSSNPTVVKSTGDDSVMFLGGSSILSTNSAAQIGTNAHKIPLIADEVTIGELNIFGDMYVRKAKYTDNNNGKWNLNGGKLYVQELVIPKNNFFHTAPADGNKGEIKLGSLVSSGTVSLCSGYKIYFSDDPSTPVNLASYNITGADTSASTSAFNINSFTAKKHSDGKIYREYTLPFQVDGKNKVEIPTAQAYFAEYFKKDAFHETTGDLKNFSQQTNASPADPVNAYSTIYSDSNKDKWLLTAADMLEDYLKLTKPAAGQPARTITSMLTKSEVKNVVSFPQNGTITLDGSDKFYILDSANYSGKVTVSGTNGRLILLLPENTSVNFNNFMLVTDNVDETTGTIKNGTTKAPKVDIYGGTGSKISTDNNCLFTAYFIMPTGEIDPIKMGKQPLSYDDGSGHTVSIQQISVVGSIICKNFNCLNNATGIAYLDKNSGDQTPGEPHLNVQSSQYIRN